MDPTSSPSLHDYLAVLRRRWLAVVLAVVLVPAAAVTATAYKASTEKPSYAASTTLIVEAGSSVAFNVGQMALLATTGESAATARKQLGDTTGYSVKSVASQTLFTVTVTARGPVPSRTAEVADVYAQALIDTLAGQSKLEYDKALFSGRKRVGDLSDRLNELTTLLDQDPPNRDQLDAERLAALADYQAALTEVNDLQRTGPPDPALRILAPAQATRTNPGGLASLGGPLEFLIVALLGLLVGIGMAFLVENLDRGIRNRTDVERVTSRPVLAVVPSAEFEPDGLASRESPMMEAYRRLRTMILLEREQHRRNAPETVIVVSPSPQEGKTTTVAHLGVVMVETGTRVLAVSADFRRPRLHLQLKPRRARPNVEVRDQRGEVAYRIVETQFRGLDLLTADKSTDDPAELLKMAKHLLERLDDRYDVILIDTAPLLFANDALDLLGVADQVVVVVRSRKATQGALKETLKALDQANAPVSGVVLTDQRARDSMYGYDSDYAYGYYAAQVAEDEAPGNGRTRAPQTPLREADQRIDS